MARYMSLFLTIPFMIGANVLFANSVNSENRKLWIDPIAKPTSTKGWNVRIGIICSGKYTTVNNIKFVSGFKKLGLPVDSTQFKFAGNAATSNWRSISSFTINIPKATNAASALAACSKITVNSLSNASGVNVIQDILFSPFKP